MVFLHHEELQVPLSIVSIIMVIIIIIMVIIIIIIVIIIIIISTIIGNVISTMTIITIIIIAPGQHSEAIVSVVCAPLHVTQEVSGLVVPQEDTHPNGHVISYRLGEIWEGGWYGWMGWMDG
jgi:hypothetical protein